MRVFLLGYIVKIKPQRKITTYTVIYLLYNLECKQTLHCFKNQSTFNLQPQKCNNL